MHKDVEQARFNMIEQQIRPWEVLDGSVLDLLGKVPREAFVPEQYRGLAFADLEIPIGFGQTMLSPKMEGRILQALEIKPTDKVLEIGTGSGYLTALLATLAREVHSIEINAELSQSAQLRLAQQQLTNVTLHVGDGAMGWPSNGPYDVIVFTGSLPLLPEQIQQSLHVNGRLFAVIGEAPAMEATMIQRIGADTFRRDILFETCLPELDNAAQPERFTF
ncbi:protein-L-isoaspartate O-methyltransferase [Methylobacillus caricis]|uniref:protein-L-isoaspartate O-methyltransferase family protein n=1 Tax=Methylobacillus caricis TaxID=1971611 RepID=UPI001CFFF3BE|nr:protein-L-isoaspartate O-methyltransferase [Methylobacillus caricis]MCB5188852.1 protein-L-isoaspartate O-methyltransferase [Methylobacillus caricis]